MKERTIYYAIKGKTAADFARSMTSRGPRAFTPRRRVWATATRSLRYSLQTSSKAGSCRNLGAKVSMDITYRMPRLSRTKGVRASELRKWRRMYAILLRHEKVHGRYYKQLANQVYKALRAKRRARSCRELERWAKATVKRLSDANIRKNARFEIIDRPNYRRMQRIVQGG
ncbi:MAG: DUF922 domain-containing protein [Pseudomonadota bacterium]